MRYFFLVLEKEESVKNRYEIDGPVTRIKVYCQGETLSCLIDTEDLMRVSAIPGKWTGYANNVKWNPHAAAEVGGSVTTMHRFILDAPRGTEIRHINNDRMDNRKSNLRVVGSQGKPETIGQRPHKHNQYEIEGETAIILAPLPGGKKFSRVKVDADMLEELLAAHFWRTRVDNRAARVRLEVYGRKTVRLHRYVTNCPPHLVVDHINHDGLDNRRANLRCVTPAQNAQNSRIGHNNTSGFHGVSWHWKARKWEAHIKDGRRLKYLGLYEDPLEAACVVFKYRAEHIPFSLEATVVRGEAEPLPEMERVLERMAIPLCPTALAR